jgi:hypothetical protein
VAGLFLRLIMTWGLPILISTSCMFLGVFVSLVLLLGPAFLRLFTAVTEWFLTALNHSLGGSLAKNPAATVFASGLLWGLASLMNSILIGLTLGWQPSYLCALPAMMGVTFGLICGQRARSLPSWGTQVSREGLQLGERI